MIVKEKGLELFVDWLMSFLSNVDLLKEVVNYILEEKEVELVEVVLFGVYEIIVE